MPEFEKYGRMQPKHRDGQTDQNYFLMMTEAIENTQKIKTEQIKDFRYFDRNVEHIIQKLEKYNDKN